MTALLMSLPNYDSWPLVRIAALAVVLAALVLVLLPLVVAALLGVRAVAGVERAALRIPPRPDLAAPGGDPR